MNSESAGVLYHFKYSQSSRLDRIGDVVVQRPVGLHEMRDEGAALYLLPPLLSQGFAEVEAHINVPAIGLRGQTGDEARKHITGRDLILVTTRPPMDDHREHSKRNLKRTDTWIEERIFEQVKRYIAYCSRSRVLLTAEEARKLPAEYERRAAIEFRISDEALYKKCGAYGQPMHRFKSELHPTSAGYVIETDPLWEDGPRCLLAWAMSGPLTVAFTYALNRRMRELLRLRGHSRFALVEIAVDEGPLLPCETPPNYAFTLGWKLRVFESDGVSWARPAQTLPPADEACA